MKRDTIVWGAVFVSVIAVMFSGVFLLWKDGILQQFSTQVQQSLRPKALVLRSSLSDDLSGVVDLETEVQLGAAFDEAHIDVGSLPYPFEYELCWYAVAEDEPFACEQHAVVENAQLKQPVVFTHQFVLPENETSYEWYAELAFNKDISIRSEEVTGTWTPNVAFKQVSGGLLSNNQQIPYPSALIAISRRSSVQFQLQQQEISSQLMVRPEPRDQVLDSEEKELAYFTWLIAIPTEDVTNENDLCAVVEGREQVCVRLLTNISDSTTSSSPESETIECTEDCNAPQESFVLQPKVHIDSLDQKRRMVFASLDVGKASLNDYSLEISGLDGENSNVQKYFVNNVLFVQFVNLLNKAFTVQFYQESQPRMLVAEAFVDAGVLGEVEVLQSPRMAADVPGEEFLPTFDALDIEWLGTSQSLLNRKEAVVLDAGTPAGNLRLNVQLRSRAQQKITVSAELVEKNIRVVESLNPGEETLLAVNADSLEYGPYTLQLHASFDDGQQMAPVEFPFEYRPASLLKAVTDPKSSYGMRILLVFAAVTIFVVTAWRYFKS